MAYHSADESTTMNRYGWDDRWTVHFYEEFCHRHRRYTIANETLIQNSSLAPGQKILDFAAGTGRTAEMALPQIGENGRILCLEPAAAMRAAGRARISDDRVRWLGSLPVDGLFDRILCGAAIWQVNSLERTIYQLAARLTPGGALSFNIPALYLGQADEPGDGKDPWLLELPALLSDSEPTNDGDSDIAGWPMPPDEASISQFLEAAGLLSERWYFHLRLTQKIYRDWLKIPVLTNRIFPGIHPLERSRRIDSAYRRCSRDSWRWESWLGWTAWKPSNQT